ncbi:MAG: gamma-glutamyl-gamma-aminobutyrate hydrolase family protein [bacterium]|nr:gamma-glutamyl-gamma-aminobutyrate hydrolase family protein [bacterium]
MNRVVVCIRSRRKAENYLHALQSVGIDGQRLIVVSPEDDGTDDDTLEQLAAEAGGLVLAGGPDIEPERYGEKARPNANLTLVPELDRIEWSLMKGAQSAKTPIWAICRGLQVVNVFLGGTLWQDLPSQLPHTTDHDFEEPEDHLAHPVEVTDTSSPLGETLAEGKAEVNSRHHQAVKDLAPEMKPVAYAPDGVLEVAEHRDEGWWLRAVQWHPENLLELPPQRRLWQHFAKAVGSKNSG